MKIEKTKKDVTVFLLYIFSFLLLWEWLRPLKELTDTGHLSVFLGFVLVSLMMSFFSMPMLPASLIKVIIILYSIHFMYFEGTFFSSEWIGRLIKEVMGNSAFIINAEWTELSNVFRTLLFFILLWLMSYLIQYWLINRKQIFVFFFMTLVYITVLDTFTPYEADAAIVRTVIAGFAVMGMLSYYRIADKEVMKKTLDSTKRWMVPLVAMIVLSVGIGYSAPKADPIWPDPVPFITSYNQDSGSGGVSKVGYGTDDSSLGGPFIGDDRVVFTAESDGRHYWRIETKDVYTGKGWVVEPGTEKPVEFLPKQTIPMQPFDAGVKTEQRTSRVIPKIGYPHLVYPLGVRQVEATDAYKTLKFKLDPASEKIQSMADGQAGSIGPYSLTFDQPVYSVEKLKGAGPEDLAAENDAAFISKYTQVPENLPERVVELAEDITKGKSTWLEKAQAIEKYFRSSNFVYDQTNVPVPEKGQDYVDQFLFETQRGYCDNFSTSMVIMMRSVGIPARWVKGYTEGEYIDTLENGRRLYEVTNNNAHSWVEGYFPGVGWVPFEPTQGFANNVQFEYDNKTDTQTETAQNQEEAAAPTAPKKPEMLEEQTQTGKQEGSFSDRLKNTGAFLKDNLEKSLLTMFILAIFAAILYRFRRKWLPGLYILLYKYKKQSKYLEKAYIALLKQLSRYGLKRDEGQTLRDYAYYVDSFFSTNEMRWLTDKYEEYLYRGKLDDDMWQEAKRHWETMIKKAGA